MLRGILTVGGWTLASRIMGFGRDMLFAALLGASPVADAFFVALKLPSLFRRLFGEGAFNAAFVPAFSGMLASEGGEAARGFAEQAFSLLAFWLLTITVLGEVFMPQLMVVLAPGFSAEPDKLVLATTLTRITFPYLLLICLTALLSGVLNGLDRYAAAAAAPLVYNAIAIGFMLGLSHTMPTPAHAFAWAIPVAGAVMLGMLLHAVGRAGMPVRLRIPRLTPEMRLLMRRMAPGLFGAGVTQLNQMVDVIISTLLPAGSVSLLYYANQVQQLPLATIGTAVGTALLPLLSRQVRSGEAEAATATMNRALEYALFLTLPAAVALAVNAVPMMEVLFVRGHFDMHSARLSAQSLVAFALGLPAFVLVKVLAPGFFARGDTSMPVKIGLVALILNLVLNLLLMRPLAHVGPALATSVAAIFNMVALGAVLAKRGQLRIDAQLATRAPRMALAATIMGVVLWEAQRTMFAALDRPFPFRWIGLFLLIGIGMASYFAACQLLGAFDLREFAGTALRRKRVLAKQG